MQFTYQNPKPQPRNNNYKTLINQWTQNTIQNNSNSFDHSVTKHHHNPLSEIICVKRYIHYTSCFWNSKAFHVPRVKLKLNSILFHQRNISCGDCDEFPNLVVSTAYLRCYLRGFVRKDIIPLLIKVKELCHLVTNPPIPPTIDIGLPITV